MKKVVYALFLAFSCCALVVAQNQQDLQTAENSSASSSDCSDTFRGGTIRLNVTFDAGGKVTNVVPLTTLPCGYTEKAIESAKQIKYTPAKKNGQPVSVTKLVEYNFSITDDKTAVKNPNIDEKAEAVIQKAVKRLGGERYLAVKTVVGRGNFTTKKETETGLPQAFVDYIVYPDKERTEFKAGGARTIQVNAGETGWIADTAARSIKDQTTEQVADFKRSIKTSIDYFLRGEWRKDKDAKLEYVGRREAGLGRRNDVLRVTYADGLAIEYEFAQDDGTPAKSLYRRNNVDGEPSVEEDRYAQFIETDGVFAPLIIDHYRNGKQTSRVNYESIQFNTAIPDQLFVKPIDVKKLK